MNIILIIFHSIVLLLSSCNFENTKGGDAKSSNSERLKIDQNNEFSDYWFSGKAELNSYDLQQSRYGEIRDGEVIFIFVTEPFSLSKQVKLDNSLDSDKDRVSVLKLNESRKFKTGIYDYSILTSTFTPIAFKNIPIL